MKTENRHTLSTFWMVNAFTQVRFAGNPAGVFIVDDFPKVAVMQATAAELNWSQTAFVKILGPEKAHIRWFSPKDETQICGHATLASAHVLWQNGHISSPTITFDSLAGTLYARQKDDLITLDFPLRSITHCPCPPTLLSALVNEAGDPVAIESVMRDEAIYVVTLKDPRDLTQLKPNLALIEALDCRAISVTTTGFGEYDFQSRYFAPKVGIPEDPVCGSSHARLAPLWAERLNKTALLAFQASKRGGYLWTTVKEDRVEMSSHAVTVFKGEMLLPA